MSDNLKFEDRLIEHADAIGAVHGATMLASLRGVPLYATLTPIERLFLLEAIDRWASSRMHDANKFWVTEQFRVETENGGAFVVDFAFGLLGEATPKAFVELDGHDFHKKTKEQVERDKKRERAIVKSGVPVLRFSGREVWRDPYTCVNDVLEFIAKEKPEGKNG